MISDSTRRSSEVEKYKGIIYKLLKVFPPRNRKDLAQTGFVALIQALLYVRKGNVKNVGGYVKKCIIREMLRMSKKETAEETLVNAANNLECTKWGLQADEFLECLPNTLTEEEKDIITMKYVHSYTIKEIAAEIHKSVSYVNKVLASAKNKIRLANEDAA